MKTFRISSDDESFEYAESRNQISKQNGRKRHRKECFQKRFGWGKWNDFEVNN